MKQTIIIITFCLSVLVTYGQNPTPPDFGDPKPQTEDPKPDPPKPVPPRPNNPAPPRPNIPNIPKPDPRPTPKPVPVPEPIPEPIDQDEEILGDIRTQTQGGWGSNPNGNNPGRFLHDHFDQAFPNGVQIGKNKTLKFTNAQAITNFLPSGGKPEALTRSEINPNKVGNNLAAQTLALTISVGMDNVINNGQLKELKITRGNLKGKTVRELLILSNNALGGYNTSFTYSELNDALTKCNECFVDGKRNTGFLNTSIFNPNSFGSNEEKDKKDKKDKNHKLDHKKDKKKKNKDKKHKDHKQDHKKNKHKKDKKK